MIKDVTLKSKFEFLQPFIGKFFHDIRKDIRNEHLKRDVNFLQKHFAKKSIDKITAEEIEAVYQNEIINHGNEDLSRWVVSKWILRHAEVYDFYVKELSKINSNFDEIIILDMDQAKSLAARSVDKFGLKDTLFFSVINSVVFPDEVFVYLRDQMLLQKDSSVEIAHVSKEISLEEIKKEHESQMLKLSDRYEKRIQAMVKMHQQDLDGLKKQIAHLQKRLAEQACC
jgi:hypothetical protein